FVAEIREATRLSFEFRRCGQVVLALDEARAEALCASLPQQAEAGLRAEWLGADDLRRLEPAANPAALGGLHLPEHALVDNRSFGKAVARAAAAAGAVVRPYEPVLGLALAAGRVVGVETIQGRVAAEIVVNAAGAWASALVPRDGRPRVGPSKGEMIALSAPVRRFERIISIPGASVSPRGDGRVYVGATSQIGVFSKDVAASAVARLLAAATTAVPTLAEARFSEAWAGLRPRSSDEFPLIGADDLDGLFWATGHGGMGIVSAPSTADILVDLVEGRAPALAISGFSPRRPVEPLGVSG
ncbi:MAG TPA: FAD-dependent oxidoreductase, partial [Chloroflexota bacterium]|nr:FAD-dependent oxidoreductase [Chloroflexota bacterium]